MIRKWIKNGDEELKRLRAEQKAFFKELDAHIEYVKTSLNLVAKEAVCPDHFHLVKTLPDRSATYESLCKSRT
jgi:hypothetical protein